MTTRLLPESEWGKLADTEFRHLPYVTGDELQVMVVEDDGVIVACWGLMPMLHVEGLWIHPAWRHRPSVARRLLTAMWAELRRRGARWVMTAASDDRIRRMLERVGATRVPADSYVLTIKGSTPCRSPR